VIVEPGRNAARREDEQTPFCCVFCSDLFLRPPGANDRVCPRCRDEGKSEGAGQADARAKISVPKGGPLPPRRPPREPDPDNPRALIRPPAEKMNIAEAGRLRKERIDALNARLRSLDPKARGSGEVADWLRRAILHQQGQGPSPGPAPRQPARGGRGK